MTLTFRYPTPWCTAWPSPAPCSACPWSTWSSPTSTSTPDRSGLNLYPLWWFKEEWNPSLITIQREISRNVTRTKRRSPPELLAAKCLPSCNWLMSAHKHYPQNVGKISNFQSRVTESTLKKYSFNYLLLTYGETLIFQSIRKKLSV